ncbi:hypothetical protein HK105_205603 [Polyrhizophydium stewartii]|uniref:Uncharacterized protein n=1 Tax=Polyrhizophydium stewartii TaxID=2732419 RepID=A0ABR4N5P2_9FUNG
MGGKSKVPAWQSLSAGAIAGAVEGAITYPTEYVKTQLQLQSTAGTKRFRGPIDCAVQTVRTKGIVGLYKGVSALVIGNSSKAAVRFLAFEQLRKALADEQGRLGGVGMAAAGLGAGVAEAVLVVTPTETIKTRLIDDQSRATPRFRGLLHGVRAIAREEGARGLYRGVTAVVARQGANSAVRMTTYEALRELVAARVPADAATGKRYLPWYVAFANGALAGIVTVYATMPLDVVKTRMQGLGAQERYRHSLDCLAQVVRGEGVRALWKGATPRLGRLIFSGGIVFSVYEQHAACVWPFGESDIPNEPFRGTIEGICVSFPQYPANSPWRSVVVSTNGVMMENPPETGGAGLVGGIRRVTCETHSRIWAALFPKHGHIHEIAAQAAAQAPDEDIAESDGEDDDEDDDDDGDDAADIIDDGDGGDDGGHAGIDAMKAAIVIAALAAAVAAKYDANSPCLDTSVPEGTPAPEVVTATPETCETHAPGHGYPGNPRSTTLATETPAPTPAPSGHGYADNTPAPTPSYGGETPAPVPTTPVHHGYGGNSPAPTPATTPSYGGETPAPVPSTPAYPHDTPAPTPATTPCETPAETPAPTPAPTPATTPAAGYGYGAETPAATPAEGYGSEKPILSSGETTGMSVAAAAVAAVAAVLAL